MGVYAREATLVEVLRPLLWVKLLDLCAGGSGARGGSGDGMM